MKRLRTDAAQGAAMMRRASPAFRAVHPACSAGRAPRSTCPLTSRSRQTGPDTYDVLWKVPGQAEICASDSTWTCRRAARRRLRGQSIDEQRLHRTLAAKLRRRPRPAGTIHIAGLGATMTDVLVRLERLDGTTQVTRLTPSAPSFGCVAAGASARRGVAHVHSCSASSTFSRASTTCCSCSALSYRRGGGGLVEDRHRVHRRAQHHAHRGDARMGACPQPPVEAVIALSIVFVAAEICASCRGSPRSRRARRGWWRSSSACCMVSALPARSAKSDCRRKHIPDCAALLQRGRRGRPLLFIAAAMTALWLLARVSGRRKWWYSETMIRTPMAYAIGSIAAVWGSATRRGVLKNSAEEMRPPSALSAFLIVVA